MPRVGAAAPAEDADGRPVYDWRIVDRIFDAGLAAGVKPYAQIGFMPQALSTRPEPYQHEWRPGFPYNDIYTGWAYPPKDYDKWRELVYTWVKHCVERYGAREVESWYWEVWNEPNIAYWQGTREEFRCLHDYAIDGVRRALPTAKVGGPDTAGDGGAFMQEFLEHCLRGKNFATGQTGTPLDFLSFHAKGTTPVYVDGRVRMGLGGQLKTIDAAFARVHREEILAIASYAAAVGMVQPGQDAQQGGLAGTGRPQQGEELARRDRQADIVQRGKIAVAAAQAGKFQSHAASFSARRAHGRRSRCHSAIPARSSRPA